MVMKKKQVTKVEVLEGFKVKDEKEEKRSD